MKNRILIIFFLLAFSFVQGQIQNTLDKTYYLLGTLGDYMGRELCKRNPKKRNYIMSLHQDDIGQIKRIEEVTMLKFLKRERKENCINCHEFYELLSHNSAIAINSFYVFEKQEGYDEKGYKLYSGKLICSKILKASKEQQHSFIAGLFLTHGEKFDDVYEITLYNSQCRYECTIKILEVLNSKIVSFGRTERTVPIGYFIEFVPSEELKLILDNEIERRIYFDNESL